MLLFYLTSSLHVNYFGEMTYRYDLLRNIAACLRMSLASTPHVAQIHCLFACMIPTILMNVIAAHNYTN